MADEVLPISMPSPSLSIEQVSTQTRSPIPTGWIFVTLNGTRPTFPVGRLHERCNGFDYGRAVGLQEDAVRALLQHVECHLCIVLVLYFRDDLVGLGNEVLERDDRPVAGRNDDELVFTGLGCLVLALLVRDGEFDHVFSGFYIAVRGNRGDAPELFTSSAWSTTSASAPLSIAVVAISLFHGRMSTQNCFMMHLRSAGCFLAGKMLMDRLCSQSQS